ncbi:DUF5107 domain-containing protein [Nonomuraea dietziae]|uniref:DUF5107 domain-containing protein n=1 Tax=Nonomuraea dietziae TaxID=65515 RepID=A0A7W5YTE7_9ACTN|nr:DUF5107 domain-containing protein [Nonomuraea dietziae]MBB3733987.1 hypothetical protein [Nonomuraea dietziae]
MRRKSLELPIAEPGPASPLPILRDNGVRADTSTADPAMAAGIAYGQPFSLLPYGMQDDYGRNRQVRSVDSIVLENQWLTATFLPDFGGRLWSLVHRPTGRELLFRNPSLQPANLALRGAWFSGGVEWNLGATGHWPLTCEPLHTARVGEGLRMWEYERMRRLIVQLDVQLPPESPALLIHISLHNPHTTDIPVYWWSNIAVPEEAGIRVVTPADHAYHFDYTETLHYVPYPDWKGTDRSYTTRTAGAADFFFDIAGRPWIAALDEEGSGLVHTSTRRLSGRKLFHWGTSQGGRRWQEWLNGPDARYLEIQAGLARTQLEHLPMAAGSTWSWTEAYGLLRADPVAVHGPWPQARSTVEQAVADLLPEAMLEEWHQRLERMSRRAPSDIRWGGSGWGALERRASALPDDEAIPFGDETLGTEQEPWLRLLETGRLPAQDPPAPPVIGQPWRDMLEVAAADWHAHYHLGLLRYADGDVAGARSAWLTSGHNPWALRCLAETDLLGSDVATAADRLQSALALAPDLRQLIVETLTALLLDGRPNEALRMADELSPAHRAHGRIQLLRCMAGIAAGRPEVTAAILRDSLVVPDLREGEDSLHRLWADCQRALGTDEPCPPMYDFRMHP